MNTAEQKLAAAITLLESAVTDFAKLAPFIGVAAKELADIYQAELDKLKAL